MDAVDRAECGEKHAGPAQMGYQRVCAMEKKSGGTLRLSKSVAAGRPIRSYFRGEAAKTRGTLALREPKTPYFGSNSPLKV